MILQNNEIKELLNPICPSCLILDEVYICESEENIKKLLKESFIDKYKYKVTLFDCEDYSLILHAWIRQLQYKNKWEHPLAFGEAIIKTDESYHAKNIMVSDDSRALLIEPQSDEVKVYENKDHIIFIRM